MTAQKTDTTHLDRCPECSWEVKTGLLHNMCEACRLKEAGSRFEPMGKMLDNLDSALDKADDALARLKEALGHVPPG